MRQHVTLCPWNVLPHSPAGFTAPQAVALSNITILGGALANFLANTSRRHPSLDRPLIDWDLTMVMEPTTMLGALLGSYMNKVNGRLLNHRLRDSDMLKTVTPETAVDALQ